MHRHVRRVGDQVARGIEQRAGEVEPLLDVDRVGGVLQPQAHLLGDGHEQVVEDLEHHRVGLGADRVPCVARAARACSSSVAGARRARAASPARPRWWRCASAMIAGPSIGRAGRSASRTYSAGVVPAAVAVHAHAGVGARPLRTAQARRRQAASSSARRRRRPRPTPPRSPARGPASGRRSAAGRRPRTRRASRRRSPNGTTSAVSVPCVAHMHARRSSTARAVDALRRAARSRAASPSCAQRARARAPGRRRRAAARPPPRASRSGRPGPCRRPTARRPAGARRRGVMPSASATRAGVLAAGAAEALQRVPR